MIRISWISRATTLALTAATVAGCGYQTSRMPPMGASAVAPVAMTPAPAPVTPTAGYGYSPAPYAAPQPVTPIPVSDPVPVPTPASGISGLEERKPDLCGAAKISDAVGKPSSVIPSLGLTRDYRIVEYRGIEAQVYVPNRVVFRLDQAGTITSIDCG